jgi:hypothetical protein
MSEKAKGPEAVAAASKAGGIETVSARFDTSQYMRFDSKKLARHRLQARFILSDSVAAAFCELSGLGGRER